MSQIIRAVRLRCEYLENPLGLHEPKPRLSWWVEDGRPGAVQTAYRLRLSSSADKLVRPDVWDSGRVASTSQNQIEPELPSIASRQRVYWDVELWDKDGKSGQPSEAAWFEYGLLHRSDWIGSFVMSPLFGSGRSSVGVPLLRKEFLLPAAIRHARLYITALGLYDAQINGKPVTRDLFRPGWTDYRKRLQYQVYDVAALLRPGPNAIGAMLGDGWYCGRVAHLDRAMLYGDRPQLLAQLEIKCEDGSHHTICTDNTWKWAAGPIDSSDLLGGEEYDARKEISGWAHPGLDDKLWQSVSPASLTEAALVPSVSEPVRQVMELQSVADPTYLHYEWGRRHVIYDFGQNFSGNVRLNVRGPRGCTIQLRYAEVLQPNGRLDVSNLRSARATDYYTLRGDEAGETWQPRFTFHGFRYAEISFAESWLTATSNRPALDRPVRSSLTGLVLMSDTPVAGAFETDHALLNKLQSNIVWGQRGNFMEVPTDCPQRDERLGWTGDAQIFAPTAAFNMEVAAFFTKWMLDMDDAQQADGGIPEVIPPLFVSHDAGPGWSDARVVIPLAMYRHYGDKRMLERHYPSMKRWIQHHIDSAKNGLRCLPEMKQWQGFGDWLALDGNGIDPFKNATPKELIATAYYAYALDLIRQIAEILGHSQDATIFTDKRREAADAFATHFFTSTGKSVAASQTSYLMALAFDLLPESIRPTAFANLIELIRERNDHLSTGFLGTPLLCPVLTRFGRLDLAYKLLMQTTYPSWLYPVTIGATTMWERWNSWHPDKGFVDTTMNSLNHYAYGAVGEWMYGQIAGIHPLEPGYKSVLIAPKPGGGISRACGSTDTPYGRVSSSWELREGRLQLTVVLPANVSGKAILPDYSQHPLQSGTQTLSCILPD